MLVSSSGTKHSVPKDLSIIISQAGTHVNPDYWGTDSLAFRPSRWITSRHADASVAKEENDVADKTIVEPTKCTFIPWSTGPRQCPGMKMSEVEFMGVFSTVLWQEDGRGTAEAGSRSG